METTLPPIVQWHEGMPLLAHHFQQMTLRQEGLAGLSVSSRGNYQYGVTELEVDKSTLLEQTLKVTRLKCIFPDGTYVDSTQIPDFQLECELGTESKGITELYLTLPKILENNYVSGTHPRFISVSRNGVVDINSSQDPIQCLSLVPNVKLEKKKYVNHAFEMIKVFELKLADNVWEMLPYTPPCLIVEKDDTIHNVCSSICLSMRKKLFHIGDEIKNSGQNKSFSYFSENMFLILGLGTFLPQIEALLLNHQSHPFELYMSVCSILGSMSLMSDSMTPPAVPRYRHDDLDRTFNELKNIIEVLLSRAVNEKYTTVEFAEEDGRFVIKVFSGDIKRDYILIGFKKSHGVSDKDAKKWMQSAIIVNTTKVEQAIVNRVLGFKRHFLERTEDIVPTKDVLLFKVEFEGITKDLENLVILNRDDPEYRPLELFVYKPKKRDEEEEDQTVAAAAEKFSENTENESGDEPAVVKENAENSQHTEEGTQTKNVKEDSKSQDPKIENDDKKNSGE